MQIRKRVYEEILSQLPAYPPEMGGILGASQGVIEKYWLDKGVSRNGTKCCSYEPDTEKLNAIIEEWCNQEITFAGIFHTHFGGSQGLSRGDIQYIRKIMNCMPEIISKLYFPVITMPEREMHVYVAIKGNEIITKEKCLIKEDEL